MALVIKISNLINSKDFIKPTFLNPLLLKDLLDIFIKSTLIISIYSPKFLINKILFLSNELILFSCMGKEELTNFIKLIK